MWPLVSVSMRPGRPKAKGPTIQRQASKDLRWEWVSRRSRSTVARGEPLMGVYRRSTGLRLAHARISFHAVTIS